MFNIFATMLTVGVVLISNSKLRSQELLHFESNVDYQQIIDEEICPRYLLPFHPMRRSLHTLFSKREK